MIINIILGFILPFFLLIISGYLVLKYRDDKVVKWVNIAVKAAEQIYKTPGSGKEKFEYVANWISNKFNISKDELKTLIESAVYELKE